MGKQHTMVGVKIDKKHLLLTCPECGHCVKIDTSTHTRVTLANGQKMNALHAGFVVT